MMIDKIIKDVVRESLAKTHTCFMAEIDKVDLEQMTADIYPLHKIKYRNGKIEELKKIRKVPIAHPNTSDFYIRYPYKKGDMVMVACCERGIDDVIATGSKQPEKGTRKHSLDDAVIIGGLTPFTQPLPSNDADGIVIAHKNSNTKIYIDDSGDIEIKGNNVKVEGGSSLVLQGPNQTLSL